MSHVLRFISVCDLFTDPPSYLLGYNDVSTTLHHILEDRTLYSFSVRPK
jgi:hypothetical protein